MSNLKEQLNADFKTAMKNRDAMRKELIQLVRAGVLQVEKDQQIEADDAVVISVIQKEVKKRRELLAEIGTERPEITEKTEHELAALEAYLPKQLSSEELRAIIQAKVDELGAATMKDMGRVMKAVLPEVAGQADGSEVSRILKAILS